jgi:ABC-2 type transport system permease protein
MGRRRDGSGRWLPWRQSSNHSDLGPDQKSKTEEAASGVANALIVPMAFLSGVFIPLDSAPGWMRSIANFMPLKHMNDGMVDFLVRGQGPGAMVLPGAVLLALTLVMAFVASRVFNWEAA